MPRYTKAVAERKEREKELKKIINMSSMDAWKMIEAM